MLQQKYCKKNIYFIAHVQTQQNKINADGLSSCWCIDWSVCCC